MKLGAFYFPDSENSNEQTNVFFQKVKIWMTKIVSVPGGHSKKSFSVPARNKVCRGVFTNIFTLKSWQNVKQNDRNSPKTDGNSWKQPLNSSYMAQNDSKTAPENPKQSQNGPNTALNNLKRPQNSLKQLVTVRNGP
jgi:hypothetical protein